MTHFHNHHSGVPLQTTTPLTGFDMTCAQCMSQYMTMAHTSTSVPDHDPVPVVLEKPEVETAERSQEDIEALAGMVREILESETGQQNRREAIASAISSIRALLTEEELASIRTAAHNEAEDVSLVLQALSIVRELMAREAVDGPLDVTSKLGDLLSVISLLSWVLWQEEWEAQSEDIFTFAQETTAEEDSAEGGIEEMTIDEETQARLAETISNAVAEQSAAQMDRLIEVMTQGFATLAAAQAPAAAPVEEAVATTEEPAEAATEEAEATVEEAPVAEATAEEAEDAFPAEDEVDEEEEEEDEESEAALEAEAALEEEAGEALAAEEDPESDLDRFTRMLGAEVADDSRGETAVARTTLNPRSASFREDYLATYKAAQAKRIPVGRVSVASTDARPRLDVEKFMSVFTRGS